MTNYNERLAEILLDAINEGWFLRSKTDYPNGFTGADVRNIQEKAKRALTPLIKELVAEAKPRKYQKEDFKGSEPDRRKKAFNRAIDEFEQNLLKALEEV